MEKSKPNKGLSLAFYFIANGETIKKTIVFVLISIVLICGAVKLLG